MYTKKYFFFLLLNIHPKINIKKVIEVLQGTLYQRTSKQDKIIKIYAKNESWGNSTSDPEVMDNLLSADVERPTKAERSSDAILVLARELSVWFSDIRRIPAFSCRVSCKSWAALEIIG